jgi:hypothetical protein
MNLGLIINSYLFIFSKVHLMKKITLFVIVVVISGTTISGQAPQSMSCQAVARDAAGVLLKDLNIGVRITLNDGFGFPLDADRNGAFGENRFYQYSIIATVGSPQQFIRLTVQIHSKRKEYLHEKFNHSTCC